ncbi:Hypothetical predicted protein [Mytilus galloprovincialis]|uniref:Mab-21-like HhH/H2TH-like domain-containing protein n=1 Tax=Mytilus galloprovincialis TaxID=29158 RepID=A0A8B6CN10_MYTGA|nr:Hypothetical predicted protein [Mytilus galloprovincialis]
MSFEDFIKGASDVCYRPFTWSEPFDDSDAEDDEDEEELTGKEYSRMLTYLGEVETEKSHSNSSPYFEVFLNNLPKQFQDICHDLRNARLCSQGLKVIEPQQFYRHSSEIYRYLLTECASENYVKAIRTVFKVLDDSTKISPVYTNISSGSKAEGLHVPGGDYDLMTVLEQIQVKHACSFIKEDYPVLLFDNGYSYPGFTHLKIGQNRFSKELFNTWGENTFYGPLISNTRFKNYFLSRYRDSDCKIHGPCISDSRDTIDHLFCFRAMLWPDVADSWLTRNRISSMWPTTDVILNSVSQGILLVPIGSKFGSTEDCSFEWRISFSLQERDLIHSFNHTQVLCYTAFKYMKRDLLSESGLCSYFIKTTVFWLCEEFDNNMWIPKHFVQCLHAIQRRLIYWIRYGYCPHYFITENNLFEGLRPEERTQIEVKLLNIFQLLCQYIFSKKFNLHFPGHKDFKELNTLFLDNSKAIFKLQLIRTSLCWCTLKQSRGIVHKVLFRLLNNKLPYYTKGLYMIAFCYGNQVYPQNQHTVFNKENKRMYSSYRQCKAHFLIGTKVDAIAGWLLLASYFYKIGNPLYTLKITEMILTKPREDKMLIADGFYEAVMMEYLEEVAATKWNHNLSFLNCTKSYCVDLFYNIPWSTLNLEELLPDVYLTVSTIPPVIYAHVLRFVCYNANGNISLRDREICDIIKTCRNNCFLGDWRGRVTVYAILAKIYKTIDDDKSANYWKSHLFRYFFNHPKHYFKKIP